MSKNRKKLEEAVNVSSTNRGFRTMKHSVASYEQTKKGLSYFHPKHLVEEDGIHAEQLVLYIFLNLDLYIYTFYLFLPCGLVIYKNSN